MTPKANLKAENISKSYRGRTVVADFGIDLRQGEVVGLLGPNGAGKTTSFYILAGLVKADHGSISIGDEDISLDPIHLRSQKGLGYLPQEPSIFRDLTTEENINAVLELRRLSKDKRKRLCEGLLEDFALTPIRRSKGRELSGGERRRVEIARTLGLGPKLILMDEPFAGVDPLAVSDLQGIILGLKKNGIGILITDHNVRETLGIVDRAYIMNEGRLLTSGTPMEIVSDEKARRLYLGEDFSI
ncbi:MAG: LPS export ABC transporter ATP-binding protein [Bacteriovoracales bacterium]|nr:LPS export ABC transporter ATP-binding protein [Bacteriovoracales bacterium]